MRPLVALLTLLLAGCSSLAPPEGSPRVAYREAESTRSLVVPPDLTRGQASGAFDIPQPGGGEGESVLPEFENIRMVRAGPLQWLEIEDATPDELWPRMRGFLRNEGLTLGNQKPDLGLLETVWAERFDAVPRGGLGGLLSDLLDSVTSDLIRDKYQIRLERTADGAGTRVFLTHWAAQEINTNPNTRDAADLAMARIQPDPAVAAEMRRRMLVYLGVSRARASAVASGEQDLSVYTAPVRLVETESGEARVVLAEADFRRAFGLVGEALRLAGAEVTESDVRNGTYWVEWLPPEAIRGSGWFSDDRPKKLLIRMEDDGEQVFIVAGDSQGNIRSGEVQIALLERVVNEMGGDISSYRNVEDLDDVGSDYSGPEYQ